MGRDCAGGSFILGAEAIAKLNAVEGIAQTASSRAMFAEFEQSGASNAERQEAIVAKHARKV